MTRVRRALVSTADRTGVAELAQGLVKLGVEILSTGGTGAALREAGIPVTEVAEVTGFPEILDGRVKTLHPRIHAGLLALRGNRRAHREPCGNTASSRSTWSASTSTPSSGPSAARDAPWPKRSSRSTSAAPACCGPRPRTASRSTCSAPRTSYGEALEKLRESGGVIDPEYGRRLALEAYRLTARYDRAISFLPGRTGM